MITFFNKKKEIVIDCFTANQVAYDLAPIVKASHCFPDWWKALPQPLIKHKNMTFEDAKKLIAGDIGPNMKTCWGVTELYKRGFFIRNWTDVFIETNKDDLLYAYSSGTTPDSHKSTEYKGAFENFHHLKLSSAWFLKEKEGIPFLMHGALYNNHEIEYSVCPGILQFDIQHSTNINLFFRKEKRTINIDIGTPLAQLVPLRDDLTYKLVHHLVDEKYIDRMNFKRYGSFAQLYGLNKFVKKDRASQCPMSTKS